jgi:drug/metabolite transporter (DMT)-like permease
MLVGGLFLFALQDVAIKGFSDRYSALQIVFVRAVVALVPILAMVVVTSGWRGVRARRPGLLIAKGCLGFLSYLGYYLAIAAMPLAEVVTVVFTAPIVVTVLSAATLGERVGAVRWAAVLVGFVAVLLVVGPGGGVATLPALLAVFAALTYACSTVLTRVVGLHDAPWTITLYSMGAFLVGSVVASACVAALGTDVGPDDASLAFLVRPWVMPEPADAMLMGLLGLNAAVGFYLLIKAYSLAPASAVAPFEYTYIVWAVLFGYLLWDEVPATTTLLGVALLLASSAFVLRWELRAPEHRTVSGGAERPSDALAGFRLSRGGVT